MGEREEVGSKVLWGGSAAEKNLALSTQLSFFMRWHIETLVFW